MVIVKVVVRRVVVQNAVGYSFERKKLEKGKKSVRDRESIFG